MEGCGGDTQFPLHHIHFLPQFHHGLQVGHSTGTASLKDKMIHHLKTILKEVLYEIFMDLRNSYYTLDRDI